MAGNKPSRPTKQDIYIAGLGAMIGGTGMVQAMAESDSRAGVRITAEKAPQLVQLPRKCDKTDERILAAWGVELKNPVEGDDLFRHATIPAGWKSVSTDHYMYSHIVDERGNPRISVMYKAAFWDRDASMNTVNRFKADFSSDDWNDETSPYFPAITDAAGKVLWRGALYEGKKDGKAMDECRRIAAEVIDQVCQEYVPHRKAFTDYYALTEKRPDGMEYAEYQKLCEAARAAREEASYQMALLYWDRDVEFPPSLSSKPVGESYSAHIDLYHSGGRHADGDRMGETIKPDDAAGIRFWVEKAKGYLNMYPEVRIRVSKGGKEIHNETLRKPGSSPFGDECSVYGPRGSSGRVVRRKGKGGKTETYFEDDGR